VIEMETGFRAPRISGRGAECAVLDRLIGDVRRGRGRALILCGEAGIGKTALLQYLNKPAPEMTVIRAAGVESEMELAYASLHQLCAPLLDRLGGLPAPQHQALEIVFGLSGGAPPDRFLVGLGTLTLFSGVAEERPLLCVIDDAQWLDQASALTLAFVARRLLADPVGIVFAAREAGAPFQRVPALVVQGLAKGDARALLDSVVPLKLDERIRDRIISEARGNPLALQELPRGLTASQLAGEFALPETRELTGRIEQSFARRLAALPEDTRQLLLIAAADPVGDPLLLWRSAEELGIRPTAAAAAKANGWLAIEEQVTFRHPLVRSAVYRAASVEERQAIHLALAEATDRQADPDRRAWHLATAATGPDEQTAAELERSAGRAQARGGLGAAATFLRRAASLSSNRGRRAARLLAAASATRDAGALDDAMGLLDTVEAEMLDALGRARAQRLRGHIAFDQLRCREAARLLASAARDLEPLDVGLARMTHLDALAAAMWVGDRHGPDGIREVARAALLAPPPAGRPGATDLLLEGFALLLTEGYAAAAASLGQALELLRTAGSGGDDQPWLAFAATAGNSVILAQELWDAESWRALSTRHEQFVRDSGALWRLQFTLNMLAWVHAVQGDLPRSARLLEEERLIAEAAGNPPLSFGELVVAASRGEESRAIELTETTAHEANARGLSRVADFAAYCRAVLYNGLGRHAEAREVSRSAFDRGHAGFGPFVVPELVEAAARTGDTTSLSLALDWLGERTRATPSEWSLGIEARARALMSDGEAADAFHRESIERLQRTPVRTHLARAHLLYGEWLRRAGRRSDARDQLRTAHQMFADMGMEAFAERTRREVQATGETLRRRVPETRDDLTTQERQIAQLARDGLSNPEIATRMFLSPRTVEWHLRKIFMKLGIHSRRDLSGALLSCDSELTPA
jgi:DNA-binding CsgD family transcriptional regulator